MLERSGMEKRVSIPCCNSSSPAGLVEAHTLDPWEKSGKYALGWVYFSIILLVITTAIRWYHFWHDKVRVASHKESMEEFSKIASPATDYELSALSTDRSTRKFFPQEEHPMPLALPQDNDSSMPWIIRNILALFRYIFYRSIPNLRIHKRIRPIALPPLGVCFLIFAATAFTLLYSFLPRPLYWSSIQFGSPPLAIRSGMLAVALMPWIVGLSMKANFISMLTDIGHERLNVLHRWLAYVFLVLSIVHTVPFYVTPFWDGGMHQFHRLLKAQQSGVYLYGTGIAALVPTAFLCIHSLGPIRRGFYELFVVIHVPVSITLLGMLFWHCHNYLTSWHYLWATSVIWIASYIARLLYLNWTNPWRMSWVVGEEAAVTVLEADAVKVTVPTQVRWKPGQYVYLRMPGVSLFENHPFTIASMCSDDYPSEYGEEYRDMVLVFRPFGGFTKKLLDSALDHGPWWTYRAFIDGPYGGMRRSMDSFDHVVLIAGGTGITAIVSHLLDLVKRMRDGKAVTKDIHLIWAMKRPETMEWFKEELRICREFAPPDTVSCQFYITAAKRQKNTGTLVSAQTLGRPVSMMFHDKVNDVFQSIASNRFSMVSNRHSALIEAEANGNPEREKELRDENTDRLQPLPQAHLKPMRTPSQRHPAPPLPDHLAPTQDTLHMPPHPTLHEKRRSKQLSVDITSAQNAQAVQMQEVTEGKDQGFDFGFPSTPTEFQKNLMRFAFMPRVAVESRKGGWSVEWGRPEIPYMLKELSDEWTGTKACVFVCGPPSMRTDVSRVVAGLQTKVMANKALHEIYLHTENYAL
ncbi:hypothetical protein CERZMDRAFT_50182 [Cercospora zeae-maydis SCOH1-5]|uniref:ferric-chelate reductase (NADPH) n=1 Tax=Cercospora zeae-maydis SCOH1-5 TaxID=717836 RepID=A0A6A6F3U0_9PEZI|nr:hypothetical protein CERZMDRAFT_50182 [Cercospora zeae-maydis SCOH1-5]